MIATKLLVGSISVLLAEQAVSQTAERQDLQAAKREYEASLHDESARVRYVTKLAQIRERQLKQYWQGEMSAESEKATREVNSELQKHPAPANADSKSLSRLLVGSWQSPRRVYIFRANGKWGNKDGPVSGSWRISGNELIEDGSRGTIILIDQNYFIYSEKEDLFFHLRVKE
jgi:hypothetical protein